MKTTQRTSSPPRRSGHHGNNDSFVVTSENVPLLATPSVAVPQQGEDEAYEETSCSSSSPVCDHHDQDARHLLAKITSTEENFLTMVLFEGLCLLDDLHNVRVNEFALDDMASFSEDSMKLTKSRLLIQKSSSVASTATTTASTTTQSGNSCSLRSATSNGSSNEPEDIILSPLLVVAAALLQDEVAEHPHQEKAAEDNQGEESQTY
jgi:hypothetical protein